LSLLKENYPQATLCMIGPDKENMLDDCKKYASELNVAVTFMGKLSKKDWAKVSEDYTIFINTTHFDNTPISVIEAMALGLPVVSTKVGGIPYLIENGVHGILVADADANAMCQAIKRIISDTDLKNYLVLNARNLVEKFDWNQIKNKWLELLK
jgi:glycosyltransferase involved in cell wall biosynthesis